MRSTSAAAAGPGRRTQNGSGTGATLRASDPMTELESGDDGSVPDKQMSRWEGEGGS